MSSFGNKIHSARQRLRLTLAEVAEIVGLPESSVQRYEKGIYPNPTRELIIRFSEALEIPLIELMGWNDSNMDADIHLLTRSFSLGDSSQHQRTEQIIRVILELADKEEMA